MKLLELETSQLTLVADSNKLKYLIKIKLSKVALRATLVFLRLIVDMTEGSGLATYVKKKDHICSQEDLRQTC